MRSNGPKINKLKGGSRKEILDIESQIKELVDDDVMKALKTEKNTTFLKMRDQAKRSLT